VIFSSIVISPFYIDIKQLFVGLNSSNKYCKMRANDLSLKIQDK